MKSFLELKKTKNQCFGSGSAWIRIKICLLDQDPHGQMRIRIQEVKKPRNHMDIFGILDPDPHENLSGSETLC